MTNANPSQPIDADNFRRNLAQMIKGFSRESLRVEKFEAEQPPVEAPPAAAAAVAPPVAKSPKIPPVRQPEEEAASLFASLREELARELNDAGSTGEPVMNTSPVAARVAVAPVVAARVMGPPVVAAPVIAAPVAKAQPLAAQRPAAAPVAVAAVAPATVRPAERVMPPSFSPPIPTTSHDQLGLPESFVVGLLLKILLNQGTTRAGDVVVRSALPGPLVAEALRGLLNDRQLVVKGESAEGDHYFDLTEHGHERAERHRHECAYWGAAPVPLDVYASSVRAQSATRRPPTLSAIQAAFNDLLLTPETLGKIGQALGGVRGLFLFGAPGNGKTCIAERISRALDDPIWIPRAIFAAGEVIRLYDESLHEIVATGTPGGHASGFDARWVQVRRPMIVAGSELTWTSLDIAHDRETGVSEAPLQLKSNGGIFVIDDLGRQRMDVSELLNRWTAPLEKGRDHLNLGNGRAIEVPFDQLLVVSTNLSPRELVDEAFLRRVPCKLVVQDPTDSQFLEIFHFLAAEKGIACDDAAVDYLIKHHYRRIGRPMRFCHPRDLLQQVESYCRVHELRPAVTPQALDAAVDSYFSLL